MQWPAAVSDTTHPDGTVYLLENSNIRSKTRQPLFPVTLAELVRRERKGEVLYKGNGDQNGILPIARADVIGAVVGFHNFKWEKTNSRLLPGAERIEIIRGYRVLGSAAVKDSRWLIAIPARMFGIGPASFFVRASYPGGSTVRSNPVRLSIGVPDSLAPALDEKPSADGLSAIAYDKEGKKHHLLISQLDVPLKELSKNKLIPGQLKLDGYFFVAKAGFYQLGVATSGRIRVSVNDQMLLNKRLSVHEGDTFLPISLKRGWYKLGIDLLISGQQFLKVVLAGDQVPAILAGDILGH